MAGYQRRVITSFSLPALERRFVDLVTEAKAANPLAPVTVVVGSNLQHIYLRRRLADAFGAVANVRFHTLLDLAGEIQLSYADDDDLLALPDGGEALIVRAILENSASDGDAIPFPADAVGLPEAIAATVRDLREGMIEPSDLREADIPVRKGHGLATVYASFRKRLEGFIDRTGTLEKAAQASEDALQAAVSRAPILVYGIHDLNELQFSMMLRLAATGNDVTFFVPGDEAIAALIFSDALVQRLCAAGFVRSVLPSNDGDSEAEVTMFSAADRQSESEEVTRRIVSDLEEGVPPGEIAVLHRLDQGYDEVVGGVLDRAGVSFYAASGLPARRSAVGKAALNLLRLICDEPRRGPLLEFLSLPCTRLDWVRDGLRPRTRQWESISKELGLVKGWEEFRSLLQFSLRNASADPENTRPEYLEGVELLFAVVEALAAESAKAEGMAEWSALSGWFSSLLETTVHRGPEGDALEAILDRLQRLAVLDSAGSACDRARFATAAERAIRGTTVSGGYFQRDGVFLGNIVSARGLRFRRVYVLECAERVFPPVIRQDPLLLDGEREAVNEVARGSLPLKRHRLDEERMLFELARQSAVERLSISYSRRTNLTGSPRLPSSLLLDLAARRSGSFQSIEEIERSHYNWFARLPSRVGFESSKPDDAFRALDASDLRFHALELAGRSGLSEVAPLWPGLDRLSLLRESREERRFGPFDGVVPPELVEAAGVLERNLSASSLANYAACPHRFFLGKVLGLSAQPEPEETLEIGAAERGTFIHRILERFVDRFLEEGGDDWTAYLGQAGGSLKAIVEAEVKELPSGVTGLPVSWQIAREEIEEDLREYLDDEVQHAGEGWRPIATELRFKDVPLDGGDWKIKVRGAIDRVDRRDSGALRVVDYKTGRVREKGDGYRRGRSLQLPIYLNAACHELGAPVEESRAEYHYSTSKGGFSRPGLDGRELLADGRFGEVVAAMAEGIASGAFFYWPLAQRRNCGLCDFFDVCQTRVEPLANRKAPGSADLREPFERLSESGGPR